MKTTTHIKPGRLARMLSIAGAHNLSLSALHALCVIEDAKGAASMTKLARELDVSSASITGLVDGLVSKGLVERVAGVGDRRVFHITATYSCHLLMSDILNA
jgi:DNA-binding MarR family transcriptional regulator